MRIIRAFQYIPSVYSIQYTEYFVVGVIIVIKRSIFNMTSLKLKGNLNKVHYFAHVSYKYIDPNFKTIINIF